MAALARPSQGSTSSSAGNAPRTTRATTVSVDDYETWVEAKRYTVYKMVVRLPGKAYFIFRRYNEFHDIYEKLKKAYPNESSGIKFPGKRILGNNFDPEFIKLRREALHDFTIKLMKIPKILEWQPAREFLSIEDQRSVIPIYDNEPIDEPVEGGASEGDTARENRMDLGDTEKETAKISDLDLLKVIGKGSFGKVYLGKHKTTGKYYAIKVLQKKSIVKRNEVKHIMAERNVLLKNLRHPFLVGLHYSFQTGNKLYFVLDYVNGGELFFHLQRERCFNEARARFYAAEITSALGYLHEQDIIYRDLKPENILLDAKGHVILTDFGLCKENLKYGDTTTTFCGTPEYLAPEVLRKQEYGRAVDWWCLGVVTYEMLYGLPPFYSRDVAQMYHDIMNKPLQMKEHISSRARQLLAGLLEKDKTRRLGSGPGDVEEIKAHGFFRSINWEDLYHKRYEPPFNPNVSGDLDLRHFDPEFTQEAVASTPSPPKEGGISVSVTDDTFAGFSYVPPASFT